MGTHRHQCPMCKHVGEQPDMLMLRSARLKPLYLDDIQKANKQFANDQSVGERRDRDTETCNNDTPKVSLDATRVEVPSIREIIDAVRKCNASKCQSAIRACRTPTAFRGRSPVHRRSHPRPGWLRSCVGGRPPLFLARFFLTF